MYALSTYLISSAEENAKYMDYDPNRNWMEHRIKMNIMLFNLPLLYTIFA